jgi:hypothetical protein
MSDRQITKEELEKLKKETKEVLGEFEHEMRKVNELLEENN